MGPGPAESTKVAKSCMTPTKVSLIIGARHGRSYHDELMAVTMAMTERPENTETSLEKQSSFAVETCAVVVSWHIHLYRYNLNIFELQYSVR